MANLLREQKIIDNNKRTLLKYIFISDGTVESNSVLVNVSTLANALNTSGYIMTGQTDVRSTYRTTIKRIFGSGHLKNNGYVKVQWHGSTNSEIVLIHDAAFDFDFQSMGDGATISNPEASSNGDILFSTSSVNSGDNFVLFIDIRKDARDYDSGQSADPYAFNRVP